MNNNISRLQNEVNKIADEVNARWNAQPPHDDLPTALFPLFILFSGEEQEQIEQQLSGMAARVSFLPSGQCDLRKITNDELDQLWAWQQLYDALLSGDQDAITKHRDSLARG